MRTAPAGSAPAFAAENHRTHTLYVANADDSTVSVLDVSRCSSLRWSGCARKSPIVRLDGPPLGIAVDETTDTVYVTNPFDGSVGVIDGSVCNAATHAGCGQRPATARAGAFDNVVVVDPATHMVYTTNQGADPGTVSVIDGTVCNGTVTGGCPRQPFANPVVGGSPGGITVDPSTDTIYVANTGLTGDGTPAPDGDTLSVINGATCRPAHPADCAALGTVAAGPAPAAVAADPRSKTVYVADTYDGTSTGGPGTVSVIDTSRCNGRDQSGCASQTPHKVIVGNDPIGIDVNRSNNSVYVTNANDDTVSVIDASTCNARHPSRCQNRPPTLAVPGVPVLPVVDTLRHTVYVVDQTNNDITVLSDNTCTPQTSTGCRHPAPTVAVGSFPATAATDQRYHTVYVGDLHAFAAPFDVTMIDTARCNVVRPAGCARRARSFTLQAPPIGIAVSQHTDSVYLATDGPLQLIDAAACNASAGNGCRHVAIVPAGGYALALDESTDTVYTINQQPDGSGYVNVIDGRHCRAGDTTGCASQTAATTATVTVGNNPAGLALDAATRSLYVTSRTDHAVSMIDIRRCRAGDTTGCANQTAPQVPVPDAGGPLAIAADPATSTVYVTDNFQFSPGAVSMIDTRHCRAGDTTGCANQTPATINTPAGIGSAVRIDPATETVYLANRNDSSVTIIDARSCNARYTKGCARIGTVEVGSNPRDLALDPAHHTAFVPDYYDNTTSLVPMRARTTVVTDDLPNAK